MMCVIHRMILLPPALSISDVILRMPGARLFFRSCTAFFTSSTVTGSVEHSRDGSAACEEASRSRSRLAGGRWSKLLKCSIHREMQPLSLLMIWPSLSFSSDVFIERPALALRRILKTWEKLLVWAAFSRHSAWSFQNFRRSLRMAALHFRFSLRYSAKFPERRADRRWSIIFRVSLDIQGFLGRYLIGPAVHATD